MCNGANCKGLERGYCNVDTDCARPYFCNVGVCAPQPCPSTLVTDCKNIGLLEGGCNNNGTGYFCSLNPNQPCVENDQCVDYAIQIGFIHIPQYQICDTGNTNLCKMQGNSYCNGLAPNGCMGNSCCQSNECTLNSNAQCFCTNNNTCPSNVAATCAVGTGICS
jgi:hypothetical protein